MNKLLYTQIKAAIETGMSGVVHHVALWRNQMIHWDKTNSFRCPAIFIEFAEVQKEPVMMGIVNIDYVLRLHLFFETMKDDDPDILDFKTQVGVVIQEMGVTNGKPFSPLSESFNYDYENVMDWILEYKGRWKDDSAYICRNSVSVTPPVDLEINSDLIIENNIIRTATNIP